MRWNELLLSGVSEVFRPVNSSIFPLDLWPDVPKIPSHWIYWLDFVKRAALQSIFHRQIRNMRNFGSVHFKLGGADINRWVEGTPLRLINHSFVSIVGCLKGSWKWQNLIENTQRNQIFSADVNMSEIKMLGFKKTSLCGNNRLMRKASMAGINFCKSTFCRPLSLT